MQDECRGWDINGIVFTPALWGTYQHLMRSDFQLFDSYKFQHEGGILRQAPETVLDTSLAGHAGLQDLHRRAAVHPGFGMHDHAAGLHFGP